MAAFRRISSLGQILNVVHYTSRSATNLNQRILKSKHFLAASNNFIVLTANFNNSNVRNDNFNIQDTDDFKKRVLQSDLPVIVDFHATWCGPCKMLAPRLESVLNEYHGKIHLAKVDIDENSDLALEYGVNAVPAVVGIKDGKIQDHFVGLQDEDKIKSFISKVIGSK